ncbi:MAG: biotin--[acetyl-CoA-carboxylase] ligase [Nitratireductor sp.]
MSGKLPITNERELPKGYSRAHQQEVVSTNATCLNLAQAGGANGLWVTANQQKAGRGSRGRDWVSENGNLFASLLLTNPGEDKHLHTLTFVASLAILDAINSLNASSSNRVELKWPNDVLLNGKKVSGILLENHMLQQGRAIIVGIGINVVKFPNETLYPAISLQDAAIETDAESTFFALANSFAKRFEQWDAGEGFASIRADWLKSAAGLNTPIKVSLSDKGTSKTITGMFEGLDENGMLLLLDGNGINHKISVADIFFA